MTKAPSLHTNCKIPHIGTQGPPAGTQVFSSKLFDLRLLVDFDERPLVGKLEIPEKRRRHFCSNVAKETNDSAVFKGCSHFRLNFPESVPPGQINLYMGEIAVFALHLGLLNLNVAHICEDNCQHKKKEKEICSIFSWSRVLAHRPCPKKEMFSPSVLQLF